VGKSKWETRGIKEERWSQKPPPPATRHDDDPSTLKLEPPRAAVSPLPHTEQRVEWEERDQRGQQDQREEWARSEKSGRNGAAG
jgi:hypothetical protein